MSNQAVSTCSPAGSDKLSAPMGPGGNGSRLLVYRDCTESMHVLPGCFPAAKSSIHGSVQHPRTIYFSSPNLTFCSSFASLMQPSRPERGKGKSQTAHSKIPAGCADRLWLPFVRSMCSRARGLAHAYTSGCCAASKWPSWDSVLFLPLQQKLSSEKQQQQLGFPAPDAFSHLRLKGHEE